MAKTNKNKLILAKIVLLIRLIIWHYIYPLHRTLNKSSFLQLLLKMSGMSAKAFLDWMNTSFELPKANLPANRFAIELANGEVRRNCSWDEIMAVCDQFKADNPYGVLTFNYMGFLCQILFGLTQFNGYIQMTQEQRDWFDQNRQALEQYEPHGGITCECAVGGTPGFGFDCAHAGDQQINPMSRNGPLFENPDDWQPSFKTPEFVEAELRAWADHLASVLPAEPAPQLPQLPADLVAFMARWDEEPAGQAEQANLPEQL